MNSYLAIEKYRFAKASRPYNLILIRVGENYETYDGDAIILARFKPQCRVVGL
jgi:DNA mismatch repair ATPase MutS